MSITRRSFLKGLLAIPIVAATPLLNYSTASSPDGLQNPLHIVGGDGILRKGDIITFQGVYAANPITKKNTGMLKQFVVTSENPLTFANNKYVYDVARFGG